MRPDRRLVLAFPGGLDTCTGGYRYDRRAAIELEARGWAVDRLALPAAFPFPTPEDLAASARLLRAVPAGRTVLIDGLALGAMPGLAAELARDLDLVGLVHHPLYLETGLTQERAATLEASERAALAAVRAVVVTSRRTAATVVGVLGVPSARVTVAVPGTDPAPLAPGSGDGTVRMLNVGAVTPRKAQATLVAALRGVDGDWRLSIAGSFDRDPATAGDLRTAIAAAGLGERVRLLGEVPDGALAALYGDADLFVSASLHEGYGMALAEALAHGLPVVAAAGGAVAETVPPAAALLLPPGDESALRDALRLCLRDRGVLQRMRRSAREARRSLPTWAATASAIEHALLGRPA